MEKAIFVYEKTYLFITDSPICILLDKLFNCILQIKKLNFLRYLNHFDCLLDDNNINSFEMENNEIVISFNC